MASPIQTLTPLEEAHNQKINVARGGMSHNGLRSSTTIANYFPSPSRPNIIPNAPKTQIPGTGPEFVTSIGVVQHSGLREVASGPTGPGTFSNANVSVVNPQATSYEQIGRTLLNDKRESFVNYRQTAPFLVDSLRKCPLSIYAVGGAKDAEIVPSMTYIRPENYNTYKTETPRVLQSSIKKSIEGSPQVDVLGLAEENPMMGLRPKPNTEPTFSGRTYGGTTGSALPYAEKLYQQGKLPFGQNKALVHFAPGYNIAGQINEGRMTALRAPGALPGRRPEFVGKEGRGRTNLPWGPKTEFQGGIWPRGNDPMPTIPTKWGYQTNPAL